MSWDFFDQIFYINLPERTDRKASIEAELEKQKVPPEKITRIEAKSSINGARGCALSHILTLDHAKEHGYERFLVLEDDVVFLEEKNEVDAYIKRFSDFSQKRPWDIFFLGTNPHHLEDTVDPSIKRVLVSSCAHAYALERRYIDRLRASFVKSYEALWKVTSFEESFFLAIDKLWTHLQIEDQWFIGEKMIVRQGESHSDIEHKFRDRLPKPVTSYTASSKIDS